MTATRFRAVLALLMLGPMALAAQDESFEESPGLLRPYVVVPLGALIVTMSLLGAAIVRRKRKSDAAIRDSEARFRALAEAANEGVGMSENGIVLDVSDRLAQMLGYERDELIGRAVADLVAPESRELVARQSQQGFEQNYAHLARRKDGSSIPVEVRGKSMPYQGRTVRVTVIQDLTERRAAEEALRAREAYYRSLMEHAQDLITVIDTDAMVRYQSPSIERILGYRPEERIGKSALSLLHPEDRDQTVQLITDGFKAPRTQYTGVSRLLHADGSWRVLESVGTAFDTPDGELVCVIHSRDVTDRRRGEETLRVSEERFRAAARATADLIYDYDVDTHGVQWFGDIDGHLGYAAGEFPRTQEAWHAHVHPDDMSRVARLRADVMKTGEDFRCLYRIRRLDGSFRQWAERSVAVRFRDGKPSRWIGACSDITDRKEAEAKQRRLEVQLRQAQKMEALGTLAGGIAHDFNNILLAMLGYSELVRDTLPEGSKERQHMQQVLSAGERARDVVRRILAFSRQSEPHLKPIRLHSVVREATELLRTSLPSTIEIHESIHEDCGVVLADSGQVHQVILNLGSNAAHAMGDDDGVLEIKLEPVTIDAEAAMSAGAVQRGSYVRLAVRDTGCGMDHTTVEAMFEPFFTTKEVGQGTGLGLSVVHGVVRSHGGAIQVDTALGEGTEFTLYLPTVEKEEVLESQEPDAVAPGGERVLFVDDEELVAGLGEQMLTRLGYTATVQTSGTEALALFRAQPAAFDVLVVDYTMPHLTGVQLARKCRDIRSDIPVILATGHTDMMNEELAMEEGIVELVTKPYGINTLARAIASALGRDGDSGSCGSGS